MTGTNEVYRRKNMFKDNIVQLRKLNQMTQEDIAEAAADSYFKESYSNIGVRGKYLLTLCY
jgi:hypothetical protein